MNRHLNSSQKEKKKKNVNTKINKVKLNPKKIAILSKRLPINLCGINKRYKVLITNRNDKTPISKSNPIAKIFNKLKDIHKENYNIEEKRKEMIDIDEIATQKFTRTNK